MSSLPTRKLKIAWTVDDGPTSFTQPMHVVFETVGKKPIPVTWYIQWHNLLKQPTCLNFYKKLQDDYNHEIALHGVSAITGHIRWFRSGRPNKFPSYPTVEDAIEGIANFKAYLQQKNFNVKFIRAPNGLITELQDYLRSLGMQGENSQLKAAARAIINHSFKPTNKTPFRNKARIDFIALEKAVQLMGLHLWGGSSKDKISAQSWEHESAGSGTGRTDTVPKKIVDFIRTTLPSRSSKSGSTVILCHDLTQSDVSGVKADILALEKAAAQHNTIIEYYTMSGLFKQLTGKNP